MDRRSFLTTSAVGAAASTLASPAIAQEAPEVTWRMPSSFPRPLAAVFGAAEFFVERVAAATGGKFRIQLFQPGEIVGPLEVGNAVQSGAVEIGHTAAGYWVGRDPTFAIYSQMPVGPNARQLNAWAYEGGGIELMNEVFASYGVRVLPAGNSGGLMGGWFREPITSVSDLDGLKVRVGGFTSRVLERVGIVGLLMGVGDTYTALERGTIDGARFSTPLDEEKLGFVDVAPYYHNPGWLEGAGFLHFFINQEAWDSLPEEYKAVIDTAARATVQHSTAVYDAGNPQALARLIQKGAQITQIPAEVLDAVRSEALQYYEELSAENESFARVYQSLSGFTRDNYLWYQLADLTHDRYMASRNT